MANKYDDGSSRELLDELIAKRGARSRNGENAVRGRS